MTNDTKTTVECYDCENKEYCLQVIQKIDLILKRLGAVEYNLVVKKCLKFKYNKGDSEKDSDRQEINSILSSIEETP